MNKNAYEVNDEILDMITGGQVLGSAFETIDRAVMEAGERHYPKAAVRAMLALACTHFPEKMSDNGSLEDMNTIMKYFDQKWKEVYGK